MSQVIGSRPPRQSRQAAGISVRLSSGSVTAGTFLPVPPRPLPGSMWGKRWTLDTVLASPTLWGPFVLSDPGLLICFQTGSNTSCGGNVQGDTVTGPECVCVCVNGPVMRSYIHCNECEARVPEHSLTLCADLLNDSLGWMCLCCLGQRFSLPNIIMWLQGLQIRFLNYCLSSYLMSSGVCSFLLLSADRLCGIILVLNNIMEMANVL